MDGSARKKQKVVLIDTQNYAEGVILAERKEQHSRLKLKKETKKEFKHLFVTFHFDLLQTGQDCAIAERLFYE